MASKISTSTVLLSTVFLVVQWSRFQLDALPLQDEHSEENLRFSRSIMTRDRELLPNYQSLCQSTTHRVDFYEPGYEFRPPFYNTVECKRASHKHHHSAFAEPSQMCLRSGLSCVQRNKTIQIAKRKIGTSCWTLLNKEVHSACECMWPVHSNGDSKHHLT